MELYQERGILYCFSVQCWQTGFGDKKTTAVKNGNLDNKLYNLGVRLAQLLVLSSVWRVQGARVNDELIWVMQAQQGSDEAFTRLVEEHQTHVYNLCYRMLGEPEAAEDAAQESFLRAYQNLQRYDRNRPFATWLLSIAAHYCIDRLRRRKLSMFLG